MRKIILNVAVSMDSFIEDANGAYDWCFMDQDYGMKDFMNRIDTIFFGRKSYELVLKTGLGYYAGYKHYVFSKTWADSSTNNFTLVNKDLSTAVANIKEEARKDIWLFGGASLVSSFMNEGLVDELMLAVHPILLGSGKPLFQDLSARTKLALTDSKTYDTGLVQLQYDILK
ncbi:dihydrofolate reductase [Panacibacter ginsenosidivorans]|uniref:Dihydrofolate reductase n=1 Tax=Panacibacter ginsenosidivorans TaxID=1813871 RepID=A0A5B8VA19_9BACT|nr:dihydrofolate reductase family protein [Panacibacter ginsenosidivorans]QEC68284.1 dihydrofolate reductase [Panacibacter ginsenosidivorans]